MSNDTRLSPVEVRRALKRGLFTITIETPRGYLVRCCTLRMGQPVVLGQSRECVRPRTARRYGEALVRAALEAS